MHITRRLLVEPVGPDRNLIFNPLSGAVDLASDREIARLTAIRAGGEVALTSAEEHDLRSRRYIFDTPEAEERYLEGMVEQAWARMDASQPEMYTVCPTLACNLACGYCFEGDSLMDKKQGVLTDLQIDLLFQAIATIRSGFSDPDKPPRYAPVIALFGGEPLLPSTKRAVSQIMDRAFDGGFVLGATTNGVNIVRYKDLLEEYVDILAGFQITLDGPKAVHDSRRYRLGGQGTFDEIVAGIDLLISLGVSVDLRVNLDLGNIDSLTELAAFIQSKGWDQAPGFRLALAGVTEHREGGCQSHQNEMLTEMELGRRVIALMDSNPALEKIIHLGFLRHLDHLSRVLEPERYQARGRGGAGPRYWYCEASTEKQYVFTPEGLIYNCTEAVGNPRHAVGRFDPELDLWQRERGKWIGRTILSHSKCRACSISTLCGGGCHMAAREKEVSSRGNLLQITIGKPTRDRPAPAPADIPASVDPYCGMAEETVRQYLRYAGSRIGK